MGRERGEAEMRRERGEAEVRRELVEAEVRQRRSGKIVVIRYARTCPWVLLAIYSRNYPEIISLINGACKALSRLSLQSAVQVLLRLSLQASWWLSDFLQVRSCISLVGNAGALS